MTEGSFTPSEIHTRDSFIFNYFKRYLLQRAMAVFDWTLPQNWDKRYFMYSLYENGWLAVIKTDKFGVIPQACGLQGFNVFYAPTRVLIQNPLIRISSDVVIGKNTELIRLQPDYGTAMDIINIYADKLALCFQAIDVNLINSKTAYIFFTDNKATAETFKKSFDEIASGKPFTVVGKNIKNADGSNGYEMFNGNVKNCYIVDKIMIDLRKILNQFDSEIGIPNSNTEKKERMVSNEVEVNNIETQTLSDIWLEMIQEDLERVRAMFRYSESDLSVKKRYDNGGGANGSNTINLGNV